jgi:1-acyl-sn-glycerol-3-phosphate acyltransferase
MDQDNLARFAFARRLGVFGSREPRAGLRHLADGRVLVIFPESELRPAGPVTPLAEGAAWYALRADVPLVAMAVRVVVRGHQAPEAYASAVGVPADADVAKTTRRLADELRHELSIMDEQLASADPRRPLDGFRCVVRGRRSWDERLARRSR